MPDGVVVDRDIFGDC